MKCWIRCALFAIVSASILTSPAILRAQTEEIELTREEREEVGRLLLEAKRAYSSKDYDVALERLESAYELYPDPSVQRRIGETLERLRRDEDALRLYQRLLTRDDVDDATRDAVERRVTFLEDLMERRKAVVSVTSNRQATEIFIDDEPRGMAPLEVRLAPGRYTLRAVPEEGVAKEVELDLKEREARELDLEWIVAVDTDTGKTSADVTVPVTPRKTESSSAVGWIFVGAGAASLVAGAITFLFATDSASTLDDYDSDLDADRPADYRSIEDRHNNLIFATWIGAGVGVLLTGIGTYLLLSPDEPTEPTEPTGPTGPTGPAVGIAPLDGGAAFDLRWRW